MWVLYAFLSAIFAGVTSILAKCGIKNTDSNVATALRTIVVLIFSFVMVAIIGNPSSISNVDLHTWIFLILSGLATGASWLCYFKALKIGDINKVVPIDKSSTILTIILAFIFLQESISFIKGIAVIFIAVGTFLMLQKKNTGNSNLINKNWFIYAILSAVFASMTSILGKVGINGIDSNLGTAIRTFVVLIMAWIVVFVTGKQQEVRKVSKEELLFIILSGFATGASWLCYYRALQEGPASVVVPIDKLSIVITIAFSFIIFKEKLTRKGMIGLCLIIIGTMLMIPTIEVFIINLLS